MKSSSHISDFYKSAGIFIGAVSILLGALYLVPKLIMPEPFNVDEVVSKVETNKKPAVRSTTTRRSKNNSSSNSSNNSSNNSYKRSNTSSSLSSDGSSTSTSTQKSNTPEEKTVDLAKIVSLVDDDKVDEAVVALKGILSKDPNNTEALEELALIYLDYFDNAKEAVPLFKKIIEIDPTGNEAAVSELASLFLDGQNTEEGIAFFQSINDRAPDVPHVLSSLGELLYNSGKIQKALPYLEKSVELSENPINGLTTLAEVYTTTGDHAKSAQAYSKLVNFQKEELEYMQEKGYPTKYAQKMIVKNQINLGESLIQNQQFGEATTLLNKLKATDPNNKNIDKLLSKIPRTEM